jgi:hypothetical protein
MCNEEQTQNMIRFIFTWLICMLIIPYSTGQDSVQVDNIYYWDRDSLEFQTVYFNSPISACESQTVSSTFIVDSAEIKVNGWVIVKGRNYIIARQIRNGVKSGYELEYRHINNQYILQAVSIYSQNDLESILFQAIIDQKRFKENNDIIKSLKSYRVWNNNQTNPKLISTEFEFVSNSKWKETKYYFDPEFNSTSKLRSKLERDPSMLSCELNNFNLIEIPLIINLGDLNKGLSEI